ncbi:manganese-dependent ADP-ribose CDP-alcohol diphosphatase isoform X1 [Pelobates cultripes]|uniref:Manganese-dependent ADP-ribose/CDP-alcohol diphosphatase n=3 Tax=Pelobates cultripes TaxID=61616 RepID=A0AAD1W7W4_PELCU|nr:manganese-dependent ADP-ribose CDP-alcohol diphosphatase isoform X1 [Pelobates cultripes]
MATHKRAETLMDSVCEDMEEKPEPYFSFGIIADIQYADIDNGYNFMKTRMRYYRNSLTLLKEAVQEWDSESTKPKFILQLGDIIDGFNVPQKTSDTSLAIILAEMEKLKIPFHHIWGNHEFYNFKRKYLMESKLNSKPLEDEIGQLTINEDTSETRSDQESFYGYHFSPYPGFRFLLIDCYDLSVIGRDTMSIKYGMSLKLLKEKNPNEDLNSPRGLEEEQFVQFNGGVSGAQLNWINSVLASSDEQDEKVVVIGHLPIHLDSTDAICLAWNYKEILSALQSHPCVIGYFAGHDHDGGYSVDASGIHHITFKGVIETPPENQAFGTMYMYEDKMVLKGRGLVLSKTLHYRNGRKEEPVH